MSTSRTLASAQIRAVRQADPAKLERKPPGQQDGQNRNKLSLRLSTS